MSEGIVIVQGDYVGEAKDEPSIYRTYLGERKREFSFDFITAEEAQEVAEELLPTQEGFFFGIYEYGEEYMMDIESTIEQLKDISEDGDYFYQASW